MGIKNLLKKNKYIENLYIKHVDNQKLKAGKYLFNNRGHNENELLIVLAGYKPFLWDVVFGRIKRFTPENVDVVIVSSGMISEELDEISKQFGWSYLGMRTNHVGLAQNIAISKFENADYIYKVDEDIFVTQNFFEETKKSYFAAQRDSSYEVAFSGALIPINKYSYPFLLKETNQVETFEQKFGEISVIKKDNAIETSPEIAKFFWGEGNHFPAIDQLDKELANKELEYSFSPIRYSIGAIFMPRSTWVDMHMFSVKGAGIGMDERQLDNLATTNSKAIVVSHNTAVGHFSFGQQTDEMKKYFESHRDVFEMN